MIITTDLAQPIVKLMMGIVEYNINIMDQEGVIVGSGDKSRIGQLHQGAREVIANKKERIIYLNDSNSMVGTKQGVNLPIQFHNDIIGTVGITGNPKEVYEIAIIIKTTVEALLQKQYLSEQLRYKEGMIKNWVLDLINPNYENAIDLNSRAHFLQIDINTCSVIILIEFDVESNKKLFYEESYWEETRISQLITTVISENTFLVYVGEGRFIMAVPVMKSNRKEVGLSVAQNIYHRLNKENRNCRIGVGFPYDGVTGYITSYNEAMKSLYISKRINPLKNVTHYGEWGIIQLVAEIPEAAREIYISQNLNQESLDKTLERTLDIFLNCNQDISETIERLHIHRNTLSYRLDRIHQLWGLDPRDFGDALKLKLLDVCMKLRDSSTTTTS